MKADRRKFRLSLWLVPLLASAISASAAERVEILRDDYGVPHIFSQSARGAAYASGYLQAADRGEELRRHLNRAPVEHHDSELSPAMQPIVAAYCAGIRAYIQEHSAGWVSAPPVEPWMIVDYSAEAARTAKRGNSMLLPAQRTASHEIIAVIDPLSDFADAPYEMVITSPEYSWVGAAPVGLPFPLEGHGFSAVITGRDAAAGFRSLDMAWARENAQDPTFAEDLPDSSQAGLMARAQLDFNGSVTIYDAIRIATSPEVFGADAWQKRIAKIDPDSGFARSITGWSRRAEYNSPGALAYYLFKMALGAPDVAALEPPESLSDNRIRAALAKARDQMETQYPYQANYGSLFRIPAGARTYPISGGTLAEAGMATPRSIRFEKHGSNMLAAGGQSATQIVELAKPIPKSFLLIPLEASPEKFARGEVQPTYFGDRRELEKHVKSRQVLVAP